MRGREKERRERGNKGGKERKREREKEREYREREGEIGKDEYIRYFKDHCPTTHQCKERYRFSATDIHKKTQTQAHKTTPKLLSLGLAYIT